METQKQVTDPTQLYFPGLEGVIAGISTICQIDPATGQLTYRGYNIHDLATNSTFEEVAYLLLYGKLPTRSQLQDFSEALKRHRDIDASVLDVFRKFPPNANPMDMLRTGISLIALHDPQSEDDSREATLQKAIRIISRTPTVIASSYRINHGQQPIRPEKNLSHAGNFLFMLNRKKPETYASKAFDMTMILYAEHEFNASAFAARVAVSTLSDIYSAVTAAVGTLKGSLHGGANERAMKMMLEIGDPNSAEAWVLDALKEKKRIMGFGHRVYKTGDSRAIMLQAMNKELAEKLNQTKWVRMADIIDETMRREKDLYPNVDFYSGATYHLLGLPIELYTPLFAMSRVAGWSAHIIEQLDNNRLIRPRGLYKGETNLKYIPIDQRG